MFGCNQFTALFLLTVTASIVLSYTHQGASRQFPQDKDYYVVTPSSNPLKTTTTSSHKPLHKNVTSISSKNTTSKPHSPSEFARSFMGGGGGGGGGWGMSGGGGGGGGWGGMSGGGGGGDIFMQIIQLIGALIILGLLGMLFSMIFGSSSTSSSGSSGSSGGGTTIIIIGNGSGRRRRALEDMNEPMDGDNVPEVMTRMEKYLTSWDGDREEGKKKVEPFKLY